jgi:hypothetical protein
VAEPSSFPSDIKSVCQSLNDLSRVVGDFVHNIGGRLNLLDRPHSLAWVTVILCLGASVVEFFANLSTVES